MFAVVGFDEVVVLDWNDVRSGWCHVDFIVVLLDCKKNILMSLRVREAVSCVV